MYQKSDSRVLWVMRDDGDMTEPMNIMLLSAIGKENRPWRSSHLALLERDDVLQVVHDLKPQIVAASAITGSHKAYLEMFNGIKECYGKSIFTIFGGPYCSTYPEVIREQSCLDAVGVLECDDAWPELLDALENKGDINNIQNILTQENHHKFLKQQSILNVLGQEQSVPFIDPKFYRNRRTDFDSLPYFDRALIYENTAFKNRYKRTHMAGRGCPFRCTYCFEEKWNKMYRGKGQLFQRYSPRRFCEELADLKVHYDTRFLKFYDDMFPTFKPDLPWLKEFAEIYPKMVGLPFHCLTRCDIVKLNPKVLYLLKQAGIGSLTMSIESGNSFIRDHIILRDMTEEEIKFSFDLARKLKINTFSNTILGIPAPKIPCIDDPNFEERVQEICEDAKFYRVVKSGKVIDFGKDFGEARKSFSDDTAWRKFVIGYLKREGLHETQSQYDRQSAQFTVDCQVSFSEFPILFPYPSTSANRYLIHKGYFDGNFDKLHSSYQNRSPLDCFTEKEKSLQLNLALLVCFCTFFSGSHNRILNWLAKPVTNFFINYLAAIPYPWATWIYQQLYSFAKSYIHDTRIYAMRRSFKEKVKFYLEMWKLDVWKYFKKRVLLRGDRPGQTLGGPPSI